MQPPAIKAGGAFFPRVLVKCEKFSHFLPAGEAGIVEPTARFELASSNYGLPLRRRHRYAGKPVISKRIQNSNHVVGNLL